MTRPVKASKWTAIAGATLLRVGTLGAAAAGCDGSILDAAGTGSASTGSSTSPDDVPKAPGSLGEAMAPPNGALPGAVDDKGAPCETTAFTPARLWRLSDEQYAAAITDLLPGVAVPEILTPGRARSEFLNRAEALPVNAALAADIRESTEAVARAAVADLPKLLSCQPGQTPSACAGAFIDRFGARAFRRPLDDAEKQELKALYENGAADGAQEGMRLVLWAMLQSPSFLYRAELGKSLGDGKAFELNGYELASALSFLLLNSIPDAELWAAAESGALSKQDGFAKQVERLLGLPRVQDNLTRVQMKWVGLGDGINVDLGEKNQEFTPELKASMEKGTSMFFANLLTSGGTVADVLTSPAGFVDQRLAKHLGMTGGPATGFGKIDMPADQRAGILTQPGLIARYSMGHSVVFRGKFVRDQLLCGEIPPPPNIEEIDMENTASANLSEREQSQRRLANPICGSCHGAMDPMGLAMLKYDPLARFRANDESGKPIDATGTISSAGDADGMVDGAVGMAKKLAGSTFVRGCIESKMFTYALGRDLSPQDSCEIKRIDGYVQAHGGKLSELITAVIYSSAFRYRSGGN
jgi:hypothetical protein